MHLKVSKEELLKRLSDIQGITERRTTQPVLSHFLLKAIGSEASIYATNLEIAFSEPISADISKEGSLVVPARKLFEIVREMGASDIELISSDRQWLSIRAGKSNFRLACLAEEEFPAFPEIEAGESFKLSAPLLSEMIEKTIYSAGEEDTRYVLNTLLFHLKDETFSVVGTDGHRLAYIKKPIERASTQERQAIIPRKSAIELRKLLEGEESLSITLDTNNVLFKIGTKSFLTRLVEGTYPNYSQVIPKNPLRLSVDREGLAKVVKRVSIISQDRSKSIRFDIEPSGIRLSASDPDLGEAEDFIEAEFSGSPLAIGFNSRYILDVLNAIAGDKVVIELNDPLSPTVFREADSEDYLCIVMPMRI